jgi:hypothetical protein
MTIFLALLSLLVSLAAAAAVFWQARLMTLSMRAATLLDLDARWRSPQMLRTRTLAAERLYRQRRTGETPQQLAESPESDMADVLDFLDTVAYFQKRRVLDVPLVWNSFYWWMENYWIACMTYVQAVRLREGTSNWANLESQLKILRQLNPPNEKLSEANIPDFVATEASLQQRADLTR